jgi:hypothetical protein
MDGLEQLASVQAARNGHRGEYGVSFDDKGKLKLPPKPEHDDVDGLCKWLTGVFNLDAKHPVTDGERQGLHGPEGHVELRRVGAPPLRFEPVTRLSNPTRLREVLEGCSLHTDGEAPGFKAEHTYAIAHVVRMLCGHFERLSAEAETVGIVDAFLGDAVAVEEHTTYGTTGQRYEAAVALQRTSGEFEAARYLVDSDTGELVLRVSDLAGTARRQFGSLPRGWLDARMRGIGWQRLELRGFGLPGRQGRRQGPHARVNVYRGHLPLEDDEPENVLEDESVNT